MSKKISLLIPGKERPKIVPLFKDWVKRRISEEREKWIHYRRNLSRNSYSVYDDEYDAEMEQLRRFYGVILSPLSDADSVDWDESDWDEDDLQDAEFTEYDDEGELIYPTSKSSDNERTLRPGETRKSSLEMGDYWDKLSQYNEGGKHKHKKHRNRHKKINIDEPYNANFIDDAEDGGMNNNKDNVLIYFYPDYHDKYERIEFNSLIEFDEYCGEEGYVVPPYVGEPLAYCPVSHCCLNPIAKERGLLELMREDTYGDMFYEACEESELSAT